MRAIVTNDDVSKRRKRQILPKIEEENRDGGEGMPMAVLTHVRTCEP